MGRRQGRSDPIAKDLSLLSPEVLGTLPAPSLDPALLPKARLSPDLYEAAPSLAYSYYPYIPAYYSRVKGQALL